MRDYIPKDTLLNRGIHGKLMENDEMSALLDKMSDAEMMSDYVAELYTDIVSDELFISAEKVLRLTGMIVIGLTAVKLAQDGVDIGAFLQTLIPTTVGTVIAYDGLIHGAPLLYSMIELYKFNFSLENAYNQTGEACEIEYDYGSLIDGMIVAISKDIYIIEKIAYPNYIYDTSRLAQSIGELDNLSKTHMFSYSSLARKKCELVMEEATEILEDVELHMKKYYPDNYREVYEQYFDEADAYIEGLRKEKEKSHVIKPIEKQ